MGMGDCLKRLMMMMMMMVVVVVVVSGGWGRCFRFVS